MARVVTAPLALHEVPAPKRIQKLAWGVLAYNLLVIAWGAFVRATGHVTAAERFGWSFVFAGLLPDDFPPTRGVASAPWCSRISANSCLTALRMR